MLWLKISGQTIHKFFLQILIKSERIIYAEENQRFLLVDFRRVFKDKDDPWIFGCQFWQQIADLLHRADWKSSSKTLMEKHLRHVKRPNR